MRPTFCILLLFLPAYISQKLEELKPIYSLTKGDALGSPSELSAAELSLDTELETVTYSTGKGAQWVSYLLPASSTVHRVVVYQPYLHGIADQIEEKEGEADKEEGGKEKEVGEQEAEGEQGEKEKEGERKKGEKEGGGEDLREESGGFVVTVRWLDHNTTVQVTQSKSLNFTGSVVQEDRHYPVKWGEGESVCRLELEREYSRNELLQGDVGNVHASDAERGPIEGKMFQFDCAGVQGGWIFIKTNDSLLQVAETKMFGVPGDSTNSSLVKAVEKVTDPGMRRITYYSLSIENGLTRNIMIFKEDSQYLNYDFPLSYTLNCNSKKDRHLISFLDFYPDSGVFLESCPPLHDKTGNLHLFSRVDGVCDGNKRELQFNTWVFHFTAHNMRVYCDGVQLLYVKWYEDCASYGPSIKHLEKTIEVSMLHEPGFLGLDILPLGEYGFTTAGSILRLTKTCVKLEQTIIEQCSEGYDLFGGADKITPEAKFLSDAIVEEFKNSVFSIGLMERLEIEEKFKREEKWLAEEYPAILEEQFEKIRWKEDTVAEVARRKEAILSSARRKAKVSQSVQIRALFRNAAVFYRTMTSLFQELALLLKSESDLHSEETHPEVFTKIKGYIEKLQELTREEISEPDVMEPGPTNHSTSNQGPLYQAAFSATGAGALSSTVPVVPPSPPPVTESDLRIMEEVLLFINFY